MPVLLIKMLLEAMHRFCDAHGGEEDIFYTHGDHLGSANWITDYKGMPIQYIHYAPYGELIANQSAAGYDERYKFTGKERDEESGYDYFGARFYASALNHWTKVDPLADKYPWISPYAYCNWNPVMLVDVTGKEPNKKLMGTSAEFRLLLDNSTRMVGTFKGEKAAEYMRNLSNYKIIKFKFEPTQTGYFNNKKGRYIYTKKGGWIDMTHFMFYAGRAYKYKEEGRKDPVKDAIQDGYLQEVADSFFAPHSAYSYEDLPTDAFGAYFGANYFDPNSNASLGEQVEKYLNEVLQATEPYFAPNFDALPKDDKSSSTPSKTNTTTPPVYTIE